MMRPLRRLLDTVPPFGAGTVPPLADCDGVAWRRVEKSPTKNATLIVDVDAMPTARFRIADAETDTAEAASIADALDLATDADAAAVDTDAIDTARSITVPTAYAAVTADSAAMETARDMTRAADAEAELSAAIAADRLTIRRADADRVLSAVITAERFTALLDVHDAATVDADAIDACLLTIR